MKAISHTLSRSSLGNSVKCSIFLAMVSAQGLGACQVAWLMAEYKEL